MRFLRRPDPRQIEANRAADDARVALDSMRLDEAEQGFRRAIDLGFESPATWFNLGLVYKFRHDWPAAVTANRRCLELRSRHHEATWNLGVAATAIRDWRTARAAWRDLKIPVPDGEGAPEADFGPTPIRLNATTEGEGEVVWGQRIDPCRARIESIPTGDSGHRWHDVVLHDVVPRGQRPWNGHAFDVFDELERMEPSSAPTHVAELTWQDTDDETALQDELVARTLGGEDWSTSIRIICQTCSLSEAHVHEGIEATAVTAHQYALAGDPRSIDEALRAWASGRPEVRVILTEPSVVA